jgi:hypothetical protein
MKFSKSENKRRNGFPMQINWKCMRCQWQRIHGACGVNDSGFTVHAVSMTADSRCMRCHWHRMHIGRTFRAVLAAFKGNIYQKNICSQIVLYRIPNPSSKFRFRYRYQYQCGNFIAIFTEISQNFYFDCISEFPLWPSKSKAIFRFFR